MDAQRAPRPRGTRADGQHLLRSPRFAAELVDQAGVQEHDLVLEIGAGTGRLTAPIADRARHVIAVELDPAYVAYLRTRFAGRANVDVVHANALAVQLPGPAFRAFGNLPFSAGTRILRRLLDDPGSSLVGLDAILQLEAARKRAAIWPSTLVSLGRLPWWEFSLVRRIPRRAFEPMPGVDGGVLRVRRRASPLLPAARRPAFVRFLARGFAAPSRPLAVTLRAAIPASSLQRVRDERGLPEQARPAELDVFDWVALFAAKRR